MLTIESTGEAFSLEVGRLIGERLQPGDVLALWGELGAGKTLLTCGIARGLGVPEEVRITSPTFTLINEYEGRIHLYHLDKDAVRDLLARTNFKHLSRPATSISTPVRLKRGRRDGGARAGYGRVIPTAFSVRLKGTAENICRKRF